jgi:hypothetical protein
MAKPTRAGYMHVPITLPDSTDVMPKADKTTIFAVHKADDGGGYANAYGVTEYEIDSAVLLKNGKVVSKSEPDLLGICLAALEKKVKSVLGI